HGGAAAFRAPVGRGHAVRGYPRFPAADPRRADCLPVRPPLRARSADLHDRRAARVPRGRTAAPLRPGGEGRAVTAMLQVSDLVKGFAAGRSWFRRAPRSMAVDGVSFEIAEGTSFGLVGESGSGKSTTARIVARLLDADAGSVRLKGVDLLAVTGRELKRARRQVQMVFQDPFASLNPRWKVGSLVAEGLRIHHRPARDAERRRVAELLEMCGLPASAADRYPHEF